jgi:abhydrolase domain-containing protein 1/3
MKCLESVPKNAKSLILLCREILQLKDGGQIALDWLSENCTEDSPIVIILPGLTGGSQSEYIKFLVTAGNQNGIRCVVFINRGLGGIELKTPRLYCAANCEDLSEVVNHVHKKYPHCLKGATGISMGGLILGKDKQQKSFCSQY